MAPPRSPWRLRALGLVIVAELVAGVVAVQQLEPSGPSATPTAEPRARVVPDGQQQGQDARTDAVERLLADRSAAILGRDRAAFVATLDPDPAASAYRTRQVAVFAALEDVPLASWSYELDPAREQVPDARVDALRGPGWWAPEVVLRYALEGFDPVPTRAEQYLTFVERDDRWFVASDDDFKDVGQASTAGIWDGGDVVVVRGRSSLVLGHPGARSSLRRIATAVDEAVPRVTRAFGTGWSRKVVVLVPDSSEELTELLDSRGDFSQIAAVATAELERGDEARPVGDRVIVNPPNFDRLGPLGRQVVLTHEVTHVATRAISNRYAPTWLVEGFADYVGYLDVDVALSVSARELRAMVRAGRVPTGLPTSRDYEATNPDLAAVYEQGWLAVRRLAETHGRATLLDFYRDLGTARSGEPDAVVEAAFRERFGQSQAEFVRGWVAALRTQLR